jgi:hypothetical protein
VFPRRENNPYFPELPLVANRMNFPRPSLIPLFSEIDRKNKGIREGTDEPILLLREPL